MKFALKALAAALAIAGASQAYAFNPVSGNDDLLLTVWDTALSTPESYSVDLGISIQQFINGDGSSMTLGSTANAALFQSLFGTEGTASNIQWNLMGTGQYPVTLTESSIIATLAKPTVTNNGNNGLNGYENTFMGNLNNLPSGPTATVATTNSTSSNAFGGTYWGSGYNGTITGTVSPNGYGVIDAYLDVNGSGSGVTAHAVANLVGTFQLESNGQVLYTPTVSNVPIPAALWLMGSGLVGLLGFGRRRQAV